MTVQTILQIHLHLTLQYDDDYQLSDSDGPSVKLSASTTQVTITSSVLARPS